MAKYDKPIPALLLTDFYKTCHRAFYNPGTEQLVSYWTPRKSRVPYADEVVCFGLQAAVKKYLIDYFDDNFFRRAWEDVASEYIDYIGATLRRDVALDEISAFKAIYNLGYLPIQIRAVPEGTLVPIGCPMIEFRATETWAFWLVNYLETLMSCNLWMPMTAATLAYYNRKVVDTWYEKTVDDDVPRAAAAGDFSMRGMPGVDAAVMADAGHLLSFSSTATIPTAWWLRNFYDAAFDVCRGTPSTEHSVVESYGKALEMEMFRHIACDVMSNGVLSMVSDTWDIWDVLTKKLPSIKEQLMERDGKVVIRPDSGNPADIICGTYDFAGVHMMPEGSSDKEIREQAAKWAEDAWDGENVYDKFVTRVRIGDAERIVTVYFRWSADEGSYTPYADEVELGSLRNLTPEEKGVVELLWDMVGGTVNSKGYKVLDKHFGCIYGDAITHDRAVEIYRRLAAKGFAANNVVLGFGSYTYQYVTRDTFGFALKVTHGVVGGREVAMFKDPVTDHGAHSAGKKSQRGMCIVSRDADGKVGYTDGHTLAEADAAGNLLEPVFRDGQLLRDENFDAIRDRLNPNF